MKSAASVYLFWAIVLVLNLPANAGTAGNVTVRLPYGNLPLLFEPNRGQTDSSVRFLARGEGYTLFLNCSQAVLSLNGQKTVASADAALPSVLRLRLLNSNPNSTAELLEATSGHSNYFIGSDRRHWISDVPHYAKAHFSNVYRGVNLVYYGRQGHLEYDFTVAPGSDPSTIRFRVLGSQAVALNVRGDLVIHLGAEKVRLQKPTAYQLVGGTRRRVSAKYAVLGSIVNVRVGRYDKQLPLVIDPVLLYSTYLGGSKFESAFGVSVDKLGSAYITGQTSSLNFPKTTSSFLRGTHDAFVAKLNASGTALVYATYLGGSNDESAYAVATDNSGNAYVGGNTLSKDFPITAGAYQKTLSCNTWEAGTFCGSSFLTKLNASGWLAYSSYFAGVDLFGDPTLIRAVAVDALGQAHVAGSTYAAVPTTPGAFMETACQPPLSAVRPFLGRAGCLTGFVSKFNASGSGLLYSTYLGGSSWSPGDEITSLQLDSYGRAVVAGTTFSADFPTTSGVYNRVGGPTFVSKLTLDGTSLVFSTFFVGTTLGGEIGNAVGGLAVDKQDNIVVVGQTIGSNFPTTPGAFRSTCKPDAFGNCNDGYAAKLSSDGFDLLYSTFLGGANIDAAQGVAVDSSGVAYVTGYTRSSDFPVTANKVKGFAGGSCPWGTATIPCADAFVITLNSGGTGVRYYSTFLGGTGDDFANGIALDAKGNAYIAGQTGSYNYPIIAGAFQSAYHGGIDAFVSKLVVAANLGASASAPTSVAHGSNLTYTLAVYNSGPDPSEGDTITDVLPTNTTFVTYSTTNGTCTHPAVGYAGTFKCTRSTALNKGSYWGPVKLTVKVNAPVGTTLRNTASVAAKTQDVVSSNNSATVYVKVQ